MRRMLVPAMAVPVIALLLLGIPFVVSSTPGFDPYQAAGVTYWHAGRLWARANGRLIDVGGHSLHIRCSGEGSPTVVLDAGLDLGTKTWEDVETDIARFTRVCTYDRLGLGFSDRMEAPLIRTASDAVTDLHRLLHAYGVSGPLVLVGHSTGGLHVRLYAHRYPDETAGIVLVDSSHEDQFLRFAALKPPAEARVYLEHEKGENYEWLDLLTSGDQVRAERSLPPVPLTVLSSCGEEVTGAAHRELQRDLAKLLPTARHVIEPLSDHYIQNGAPATVVREIRRVVDLARGRPVEAGEAAGRTGEGECPGEGSQAVASQPGPGPKAGFNNE